MTWLFLSIAGYFSNAFSALIDKVLLNRLVSHPAVYAFFVSLLSLFALFLSPFGWSFPTPVVFWVSMAAGILFTAALLFFFTALKAGEVSRISPIVGGISPIFVFILAWLMLAEILSVNQIAAFFIILTGGFLISRGDGAKGVTIDKKVIVISIIAAFLFALSHVLTKWVYVHHSFVSGLVWRSIGCFAGSMLLLSIPHYRREIAKSLHHARTQTGVVFIIGQLLAAGGFVLINYAFSLGSIALVNALAGTQYLFLFFMILPLSKKYQNLLEENVTPKIIRQKIMSLVLISAGIVILFI